MKKVYYYNDKARAVISQEELRERIRMGETDRLWHKYNAPTVHNWNYKSLERPDITTYSYKLYEIPIHPDWETIVEDDLTLDRIDYEQLIDVSYDKVTSNLVLKLINNIQRIKEYEYKGIKFY